MTVLATPRLRLEPFCDAHLDGLNELNRDPEVMRYITGRPETLDETRAGIERVKTRWAEWGYSWWSFIELETGRLIGAGCVQHLGRDRANPHELGWRLRRDRWGLGLASEAAQRIAQHAFAILKAPQLVAVCDPANHASARVMTRLGMGYRGIERWYDMDCAVYGFSAAEWAVLEAGRAARRGASDAQRPPTK